MPSEAIKYVVIAALVINLVGSTQAQSPVQQCLNTIEQERESKKIRKFIKRKSQDIKGGLANISQSLQAFFSKSAADKKSKVYDPHERYQTLQNFKVSLIKSVEPDLAVMAKDARENRKKCGGSERILIIFDIDDTLLAASRIEGSIPWEKWPQKNSGISKIKDGLNNSQWSYRPSRHYMRWWQTHMMTQPNTNTIVASLQNDGFNVIAMTARSKREWKQTVRELKRYKIDFNRSKLKLLPLETWQDDLILAKTYGKIYAGYIDGIFFNSYQKGVKSERILKAMQSQNQINCIFFADDSEKHYRDFDYWADVDRTAADPIAWIYHYTGLSYRYELLQELARLDEIVPVYLKADQIGVKLNTLNEQNPNYSDYKSNDLYIDGFNPDDFKLAREELLSTGQILSSRGEIVRWKYKEKTRNIVKDEQRLLECLKTLE